jgi:type IV secretory pathway VirB2 component (pilin)
MHKSHALIDPPLAGCASSVRGPPYLTIGVVFIASVGYGLIFRCRIKFDDGQIAIVLAFFRHQHLA